MAATTRLAPRRAQARLVSEGRLGRGAGIDSADSTQRGRRIALGVAGPTLAPVDRGLDGVASDSRDVTLDGLDDVLDQRVAEQVGLEAEVEEVLMLGIVVVLLLLPAGVGDVLDGGGQAVSGPGVVDLLGQLQDRELLGELIVDAILTRLGGIERGQLDAANGVADVQEAAGLAALAVDAEGLADSGLDAVAVEHGAPNAVVVEARGELGVEGGLGGGDAVDHALVEVGGTEVPDPAGEIEVVAVVDLGEVVDGPRLLGVEHAVVAAVVLDVDEPLLDVDVGGPVLAHGAQLDDVAVGGQVADGEEQVEGADHVVDLGLDGTAAADHRVGGGALLGEVDHRIRLGDADEHLHRRSVTEVKLMPAPAAPQASGTSQPGLRPPAACRRASRSSMGA